MFLSLIHAIRRDLKCKSDLSLPSAPKKKSFKPYNSPFNNRKQLKFFKKKLQLPLYTSQRQIAKKTCYTSQPNCQQVSHTSHSHLCNPISASQVVNIRLRCGRNTPMAH